MLDQRRRRWANIEPALMLDQRRRRWANIEPALGQCFVFTVDSVVVNAAPSRSAISGSNPHPLVNNQ